MLPTNTSQRGITLIEMIVTVSIILLVFSASIAGFFRFNDRQEVQNTANAVKQLLQSARTRARVRDNPASCTLQGYRVKTNGTTIEQKLLCGSTKFSVTEDQVRQTFTIPSGITVTNLEVSYYTLQGAAEVTSPANNRVYVSGSSVFYYFEVRPSGEITEGCYVASAGSTTCI